MREGSARQRGEGGAAGVACDPNIMAGPDPLPLRLPERPKGGLREGERRGGLWKEEEQERFREQQRSGVKSDPGRNLTLSHTRLLYHIALITLK